MTHLSHSHQWIFVTDTVDAIYRPDNTYPEALMDQLAEIAGNLPMTKVRGPFLFSMTLH